MRLALRLARLARPVPSSSRLPLPIPLPLSIAFARALATPSSARPTLLDREPEAHLAPRDVRDAAPSASPELTVELPDGADYEAGGEGLPSNLTYEGLDEMVDSAYGAVLHAPTAPGAPVLLPLSSLASQNPTLAAESNVAISLPPHIFALPLRRDVLHRAVVWYLSTLRQGTQATRTRASVAFSGKKVRPQKGTGKARAGDAGSGTRRKGAPIHPLSPRSHALGMPRKLRALALHTALSAKLAHGRLRVVGDLDEGAWAGTAEACRALADGPTGGVGVETTAEAEAEAAAEAASAAEAEGAAEAGAEAVQAGEAADAARPQVVADPAPAPAPSAAYVTRFGLSSSLSILFVHAPSRAPALERTVRNLPGVAVRSAAELEAYDVLKHTWVVLDAAAVDALAGDGDEAYEFGPGDEAEADGWAFEDGEVEAEQEGQAAVEHEMIGGNVALAGDSMSAPTART
ncbi:54S ribosomal protein yml6, mitochondrial [Cryptotrichosporon argae]